MPDAEHTILLVDDEAPILRALQRLFRREGYRILTAGGRRTGPDPCWPTPRIRSP